MSGKWFGHRTKEGSISRSAAEHNEALAARQIQAEWWVFYARVCMCSSWLVLPITFFFSFFLLTLCLAVTRSLEQLHDYFPRAGVVQSAMTCGMYHVTTIAEASLLVLAMVDLVVMNI